jgi:manganese-dependent inorganic pyrophosphatase
LRGLDAEVVALGEVNEETAFALDYFGVTAPRVVTSAKSEGVDTVILTDHNEFQQSISDIETSQSWALLTTIVWQTLKQRHHCS